MTLAIYLEYVVILLHLFQNCERYSRRRSYRNSTAISRSNTAGGITCQDSQLRYEFIMHRLEMIRVIKPFLWWDRFWCFKLCKVINDMVRFWWYFKVLEISSPCAYCILLRGPYAEVLEALTELFSCCGKKEEDHNE